MFALVMLLSMVAITAPGSVMPVPRRSWWAQIAAIGVIVVSKPAVALLYAWSLDALPDTSFWGRFSAGFGVVAAPVVWPVLWRTARLCLPDREPGDNGGNGGGGGSDGPDPRPNDGGPKGTPAKPAGPDIVWVLPGPVRPAVQPWDRTGLGRRPVD